MSEPILVYDYLDYRQFMRDYFAHLKKTEGYTLRLFSRKAGFSSHAFFKQVVDGQRSATASSAWKIAKGLGLAEREANYFQLIVRFAEAKDVDEQNSLYHEIVDQMRKSEINRMSQAHFRLFSEWYVVAIREMVVMDEFIEDYAWIAKKLYPPIEPEEAKAAIEKLIAAEYLVRDENGMLQQRTPSLTTGAEVHSFYIQNYHLNMLDLARRNVFELRDKWRDISSLTFVVNREQFLYLKKSIVDYRRTVLQYLNDYQGSDFTEQNVYNLNIQLFASSEPNWKEKAVD